MQILLLLAIGTHSPRSSCHPMLEFVFTSDVSKPPLLLLQSRLFISASSALYLWKSSQNITVARAIAAARAVYIQTR